MTKLYIPPPHLPFRLIGYHCNHALYSRKNGKQQVGHEPADEVHHHQYFTLYHGRDDHGALYAIRGVGSEKFLYSGTEPNGLNHVVNPDDDECWFELECGAGDYTGYFRLITPSADRTVFSRKHAWPEVGNIPVHGYVIYPDQYFRFCFDDMEVLDVVYTMDDQKSNTLASYRLSKITYENFSHVDQDTVVKLNEVFEQTSFFRYGSGLPLPDGFSFKAILPNNGGAVETPRDCLFNQLSLYKARYIDSKNVQIFPATTAYIAWVLEVAEVEVPYTLKLRSSKTNVEVTTAGVWTGHQKKRLHAVVQTAETPMASIAGTRNVSERGEFKCTAGSRFTAWFEIDEIRHHFTGTLNPSVRGFVCSTVKLEYSSQDELTATHDFQGRIGKSGIRLVCASGVIISSTEFDQGMVMVSATTVDGTGTWTSG